MRSRPGYFLVSAILSTLFVGCVQRSPIAIIPTTAQRATTTNPPTDGEPVQKTGTQYPLNTVTFEDSTTGPLLLGASSSSNYFVRLDPKTLTVIKTFAPPVGSGGTVANPFGLTSLSVGGKPVVLYTTQIGEPWLGRLTFERHTLLRASYCRFAKELTGGVTPNPSSNYYYSGETPRHMVSLVGGDLVEVAFHNNKPCTTSRFFHDPLLHANPFALVYNPENHDVYLGDLTGHILEIGQNHKLVRDFVLPGAGKSSIPLPTAMLYVPELHGIAFENPYNSTIGGITSKGKLIEVHVGTMGLGTTPYSMTLGRDGTIWAAGGADEFFRLGATANELKYGAAYRYATTRSSSAPELTGIVTIPISSTVDRVFVTDAKAPFAVHIDAKIKI